LEHHEQPKDSGPTCFQIHSFPNKRSERHRFSQLYPFRSLLALVVDMVSAKKIGCAPGVMLRHNTTLQPVERYRQLKSSSASNVAYLMSALSSPVVMCCDVTSPVVLPTDINNYREIDTVNSDCGCSERVGQCGAERVLLEVRTRIVKTVKFNFMVQSV